MDQPFAPDDADSRRGATLIAIAWSAMRRELGQASTSPADAPWLAAPGATFVTLTKDGELRGCIGTLVAHRSLGDDVEANARAAALRDPRFPPVQVEELPALRVEVSELSAPERLIAPDRASVLAQLHPAFGYVLECGSRRATFLPQVWEQLPEPAHFLEALERKAGLGTEHWRGPARLERYTVRKWEEAP